MEIPALGRYQIRDELGRGTMGVVYRGFDPVLDREIAIKTVDFAPGTSLERKRKFLDRFFLEAKIAGKLIHPNIVVTHDAATDDSTGIPFIAMELVTGGSLADLARPGERLSWGEVPRHSTDCVSPATTGSPRRSSPPSTAVSEYLCSTARPRGSKRFCSPSRGVPVANRAAIV